MPWPKGNLATKYGRGHSTTASLPTRGKDAANRAQKAALDGGAILIKDVIADAFLQQILLRPAEYSVIATLNLNGDYVSDALAAQVGGIGIAPGANINYNTGIAIFEATPRHCAKIYGPRQSEPKLGHPFR